MIEAKALDFRIGGTDILRGVDICVSKGQFFGIIGPNGSGKSTLLKLLSGIERPLAGTVEFAGRDLNAYPRKELARLLAVLQQDALPPLGYYMLLVLWLGIGESSKIVLLFLTGFPVMVVSASAAVRNVQQNHLRVARSLGLNERQVFWSVIFPSTLPALFTAARLTIGVTFGSLVAAEIVAATRGLGFVILNSSQYLRTEYVFMGILIVGVIAMILDKLASTVERWVVPWAGRG